MFYKSNIYVLYFVASGLFSNKHFSHKTTPRYDFLFAANYCRIFVLQFISSTFIVVFPYPTIKFKVEMINNFYRKLRFRKTQQTNKYYNSNPLLE
jgi:hypothetical protein